MKKLTVLNKSIITALCVALCVVLPMALHAIPKGGVLFSPMHLPVLLCGLVCGAPFGLICGILGPFVSSILTGLRGSLSSAFMLLTLAEMMGAHSGLGYFIRNFADYANYTNVLAGILLVALVITLLNRAVTALETRLVRWH